MMRSINSSNENCDRLNRKKTSYRLSVRLDDFTDIRKPVSEFRPRSRRKARLYGPGLSFSQAHCCFFGTRVLFQGSSRVRRSVWFDTAFYQIKLIVQRDIKPFHHAGEQVRQHLIAQSPRQIRLISEMP